MRVLLAAMLVVYAWASNPACAQGMRMQPLGAVHVIGPDGAAGEAISHTLLAAWQSRGGQARYTGAPTTALALRSLAAARDQSPADLVLLDPAGAEQAFARGLIVRLPRHAMPVLAAQLPLAREASELCATIAFDALAITFLPDTARPAPLGLQALAEAPLRDRLALPMPSELLGAYLVGLLAIDEAGDWRLADAGLRRLRSMRGEPADLESPPQSSVAEQGTAPSVAVAWNSAAQLQREAAPAHARPGVIIPREGAMLRPLLLCLSASSPNLRGAYAMVELALRPETQASLAASLFMAPAREGVELAASVGERVPSLAEGKAHLMVPDNRYLARLRGGISQRGAAPPALPPSDSAASQPN